MYTAPVSCEVATSTGASCGEVWPKNDFAACHRSGLGAGGLFDRYRAGASLRVEAEHPLPADPLHPVERVKACLQPQPML